jgi:hypothetical protein
MSSPDSSAEKEVGWVSELGQWSPPYIILYITGFLLSTYYTQHEWGQQGTKKDQSPCPTGAHTLAGHGRLERGCSLGEKDTRARAGGGEGDESF